MSSKVHQPQANQGLSGGFTVISAFRDLGLSYFGLFRWSRPVCGSDLSLWEVISAYATVISACIGSDAHHTLTNIMKWYDGTAYVSCCKNMQCIKNMWRSVVTSFRSWCCKNMQCNKEAVTICRYFILMYWLLINLQDQVLALNLLSMQCNNKFVTNRQVLSNEPICLNGFCLSLLLKTRFYVV